MLQAESVAYPYTTEVLEPLDTGMFEPVTLIAVPVEPDVGVLVIDAPPVGGSFVTWNSLAACALPPLIWAHTIYVVPTVSPDGQLNVPEKVPFVTVSVVGLTELNGLQVASVISVLYPKVTGTVPLAGVMFEPATVIVVPARPDVGVLVIDNPPVGGSFVTWNSLAACALPPLIWAHTIYVVPTVSPDGQLNVPEKVPFVTVSVVGLTEVNGLQVASVISGLYPKLTGTVPLAGVMFEPVTVIVVPARPDVGLLVIDDPPVVGSAVTWKVLLPWPFPLCQLGGSAVTWKVLLLASV